MGEEVEVGVVHRAQDSFCLLLGREAKVGMDGADHQIELRQERVGEVEGALESARYAIEAYARVAVDRSDLGAIATMSEYVWRWLKRKVDDLSEDQ